MVAKITFPKRTEAALNYNEQKVQKGKAVCLAVSEYLKESNELNFYQKLARLQMNNELNSRASTKTLHVSLNFDPSEKLANGTLIEIAGHYMEKIGFGGQPYLIYKHEDAGHPHIHIVSTTIRSDGSRINTHNIGRNASENARKELEQQYRLVKAEHQKTQRAGSPKIIPVEKAVYGKLETKHAIANIVGAVFTQYRFSSLPEYNAALRQYNVIADRGKEGGRIFQNGGLVYRLLNTNGEKIGVPIKASSLSCQPTLKRLEERYTANSLAREPMTQVLRQKIDTCLPRAQNIDQLTELLTTKNVFTLVRKNSEGRVYGITYVDNDSRCVFNGSDLGKQYSAAGLQNQLKRTDGQEEGLKPSAINAGNAADNKDQKLHKVAAQKAMGFEHKQENLINALLSAKEQHDNVPGSLLKKKRKKKKNRDNNF